VVPNPFQTPVTNYQSKQCHIPGDCNRQQTWENCESHSSLIKQWSIKGLELRNHLQEVIIRPLKIWLNRADVGQTTESSVTVVMTRIFQWNTNLLGRLTLWGHRGGKWVCGIKDRRHKTITWVNVTKKQRWLPICRRRKKISQLHSRRGVLSHNGVTPNVHDD
jgi:ATP-dependent Clp protease adapter protein ClpS